MAQLPPLDKMSHSELAAQEKLAIRIDYTNYRDERRIRRIIPIKIRHAELPYHKSAQWFLDGFDIEKCAFRTFAFSGIHAFLLDKVIP